LIDATGYVRGGRYRYIPAVFHIRGGVAAEPGFEIVRFRFRQAVALR
jgi:hypothetical protein